MVYVLVAHILFPTAPRTGAPPRPAFETRRVVSVEIESSWSSLTSTAKVQLPKRHLFHQNNIAINDWLKAGDPIQINLGYNQTLVREFTGYIREVTPGVPVELACEDAMYLLKRRKVKVSYQRVTVRQLLHNICPPGTRLKTIAADLGSFKATNVTVAKVLEKLKEQYGFVSYYRNGTLYCGRVYHEPKSWPPALVSFERHVLADELAYRPVDNLKFVVKATSHVPDGKDIEITVGDISDPDAEERTLQYFNVTDVKQLRAYAQADVARLKRPGYTGSFTTYGLLFSQDPTSKRLISTDDYVVTSAVEYSQLDLNNLTEAEKGLLPFHLISNEEETNYGSIEHGQTVRMVSTQYPERNGDFFVDAVRKTFSQSGYRQEITLGSQAALAGLND